MTVLKLEKIGDAIGAIFPKDLLTKLNVQPGDSIEVTDVPGGVLLAASEAEFERQMSVGRAVMTKRHHLLQELAK